MITRFLFVISFLTILSCSKQESFNHDNLNEVSLETRAIGDSEAAIASFYSSWVEDGKFLWSSIRSRISSADWNALSSSDRAAILNFSDQQYAILAMYIDGIKYGILPPSYFNSNGSLNNNNSLSKKGNIQYIIFDDRVKDCLGVAFGIAEIRAVLDLGSLNSAVASKAAGRILKAVARRYVGWIGVAIMVSDFYDCYNG